MVTPANPDSLTAYQQCVRYAAAQGDVLMGEMVQATRSQIFKQVGSLPDSPKRVTMQSALRLLNHHERLLRQHFPQALLAEFSAVVKSEPEPTPEPKTDPGSAWLSFELLELMDDMQVQERVEVARIQELAIQVTEVELSDLNRLICGAQGLTSVHADRNPMRPEIYARTLRATLLVTNEDTAVRLVWMQYMGEVLGQFLVVTYRQLSQMLRSQGVVPAGYLVTQAPQTGRTGMFMVEGGQLMPVTQAQGVQRQAAAAPQTALEPVQLGPAQITPAQQPRPAAEPVPALPQLHLNEEKLLTLGHLRRLLAGELDPVPSPQQSAPVSLTRGSMNFPQLDFSETVPAAFEALQEMKQVGAVMQRLQNRHRDGLPSPAVADASLLRAQFRREARGMGQTLGLEVVQLMVDNIAHDARLLPPMREAVLTLEPALLRLALKDPRFFSDRHHAARRLLEEITQRSLGYASVEADGFAAFLQPVQNTVEALALVGVDGPEPFEHALTSLREDWDRLAAQQPRKEKAVQALLQAEQRNTLAVQIARELRDRADMQFAPSEVQQLLLGPWAHAMAQARLNKPSDGNDPEGYGALVPDLIWSTRPPLARGDRNRLVRLIPELIRRLRLGLESINYPSDKRDTFLDILMDLHQQAFKPGEIEPSIDPAHEETPHPIGNRAALDAHFDKADEAGMWLVGNEAKDSGFFDSDSLAETTAQSTMQFQPTQIISTRNTVVAETPVNPIDALLQPGVWLELSTNGSWARIQLMWISPQGALLMFTTAAGEAQSMMRRSFDRLYEKGLVRPLAEQTVVDGALNAVAKIALRNSVDVRF